MEKQVTVTFLIEATDGSSLSFITDGRLTEDDKSRTLFFVEQTDAKLDTKVTILPEHVIIERFGVLNMTMDFIIGQTTYVKMQTNFKFELTMECVTQSMRIEGNLIDIIYQTDTDRENDITHHLLIKFE
jgi:uncharacterized beta-barrel protein YwiB (DUF1934 family)